LSLLKFSKIEVPIRCFVGSARLAVGVNAFTPKVAGPLQPDVQPIAHDDAAPVELTAFDIWLQSGP